MDVGAFVKSPWRLAAWLLIPPALMASLHYGVGAYERHVSETLYKSRKLAELVPTMESALTTADVLIKDLPAHADSGAALASRISEHVATLASRHEVLLLSFTTAEATEATTTKDTPAFGIVLEGTWIALTLFLNSLQTEEPLAHVERFMIVAQRVTGTEGHYRLELRIRSHETS